MTVLTPFRSIVMGVTAAYTEASLLATAAISEEHGNLLVSLAAVVASVVAAVAWIDARITVRIEQHTREDILRHEAILAELRRIEPSPSNPDRRRS